MNKRGENMEPSVTAEELQLLIKKIVSYSVPRSILLFGSQSGGDSRADSDIDLCILYDELPKRKLKVMQDLYERIFTLPGRPVDLLVYPDAHIPGSFESVIQTEGHQVYG